LSLIGIDIGTTSCKVCALSEDGILLYSVTKEYPIKVNGRYVEIDPDDIWNAVVIGIKKVIDHVNNDTVRAISVSAMGDTFTPIAKDGSPLMNSIVSFDSRAYIEAKYIEAEIGREHIFEITGQPINSMYVCCKILWLKRNNPRIIEKVWKYFCYEEYILYKLGAEPYTSYSSAGRTMLFNNKTRQWDNTMLDICKAKTEQFSKPCNSGKVIGSVSKIVARELNLTGNVLLISGAFDQASCALACNVTNKGEVIDTTGTNEIIFFVTGNNHKDLLLNANMSFSYHAKKNTYCSFGQIFNAGGSLRWYRDRFFCKTKEESQIDMYNLIEKNMPVKETGIFFLPYLSGMGTPEMDTSARGAFYGLMLDTDKYKLAKAILEGTVYELNINLDLIKKISGESINTLKAVGGATNSPTWMQLKADITNCMVEAYHGLETGAIGAAILAGRGCNVFKSLREGSIAVSRHRKKTVYLPNKEKSKIYKEEYSKYLMLREKMKNYFKNK
jgi:xylulokinase